MEVESSWIESLVLGIIYLSMVEVEGRLNFLGFGVHTVGFESFWIESRVEWTLNHPGLRVHVLEVRSSQKDL